MQAPVVNTSLTALQDWTRRTAAVGWALAYLHEQRASNTDTGVFLLSRRLTMSKLSKLRLSLSGSSLSAQKAANGIRTAGVVAFFSLGAPMTDRFVQHHARLNGEHTANQHTVALFDIATVSDPLPSHCPGEPCGITDLCFV